MPACHYHDEETEEHLILGFHPTRPADTLKLAPVQSTRIAGVAYDEEHMVLYIAFPSGTVYSYDGVEPDVHEAMLSAPSIGAYFAAYVKGPKGSPIYPYREVPPHVDVPPTPDPESQVKDSFRQVNAEEAKALRTAVAGEVLPKTASNTIPELPERDEELKTRALAVQSEARALAITSGDLYCLASDRLVVIRAERAMVKARLDQVYDPAYAAYLAARALRDEALAPYDQAEKILKQSMLDFHNLEQRQRREAEAAERRRLEAAAREEAERRSHEEADREARYAEAQGEPALAHSIRSNPLPVAPAPVAPVVMQSAIPAERGMAGRRENWQYRILNADRIPMTHEFYSLDEKKIAARVKLLKSNASIPDVLEAYDAGTIAAPRKAS